MDSVFKVGDIVKFDVREVGYEEWEDVGYGCIDGYDKCMARIVCLNTYFELGDKNAEYYDIHFLKDGKAFEGVSGYHLSELFH